MGCSTVDMDFCRTDRKVSYICRYSDLESPARGSVTIITHKHIYFCHSKVNVYYTVITIKKTGSVCMYNVIFESVRVTFVTVEKQ